MLGLLLATLIFAVLSLAAPRSRGYGKLPPLRFTANGNFQIAIFEDLHFGENAWDSWGPQQDINSVIVMNEILDIETPQLVVLNGDLITGDNAYKDNATVKVDQIVGPLVQRGLTWASTYGNHDSAYNLSRPDILAREHLHKGARTTQMVFGPDAGVSNYYLPVYGANSSTFGPPELILWFFDSRGGAYYQQVNASGDQIPQPDWVDTSVVDWFTETSALLAGQHNQTIPSLVFVHIPTNASLALQTEAAGVNPNYEPGINDDFPLAQQGQGWCEDGTNNAYDASCDYGDQDVPFMEALVSTPGIMGVFSGHDHGDDWCYHWEGRLPGTTLTGNGLNLCFGRHSGYGGYGTWTRGSRQIYVTEQMLKEFVVNTWVRLETGVVSGNVVLNSTYGEDFYPAVNDTHTSCPTCNYSVITNMPGT